MLPLGKLFLLPVPISHQQALNHIPQHNLHIISQLNYFIAENAKTARAHLKLFGYEPIQRALIEELNEHSVAQNISMFIEPLLKGQNLGLMSDAGCPGIADPGAAIVKLAHQKGIQVIPLTGPSSIVLSIMTSGFNGQNFAFVGYLPIEKSDKVKRIKELEILAIKHKQAQFFIETPYRNDQIFDVLLSALSASTLLFVGKDLSGANEWLLSLTVADWRKRNKPEMNKIPVVFGIYG